MQEKSCVCFSFGVEVEHDRAEESRTVTAYLPDYRPVLVHKRGDKAQTQLVKHPVDSDHRTQILRHVFAAEATHMSYLMR